MCERIFWVGSDTAGTSQITSESDLKELTLTVLEALHPHIVRQRTVLNGNILRVLFRNVIEYRRKCCLQETNRRYSARRRMFSFAE